MRRLVSIVTPPTQTALTTTTAVRDELTGVTSKTALRIPGLIEQASDLIVGYIGGPLARATVRETFLWGPDQGGCGTLILTLTPVATLTSVAFDGVSQDVTGLDYDEAAGLVYRQLHGYDLDYNVTRGYGYGYRTDVVYDGGYLLPGQTSRDLPHAIERACIDIVSALWHRPGRGDPMIRSESIDGIGSTQYLDPLPGVAGGMPPSAVAALAPYRKYTV